MDSFSLLVHNAGYIFNAILVLFLAFVVYLKDRKPLANRMLILGFLATAVYIISHVIGVNIEDSDVSRSVLMLNVFTLIFTAFYAHAIIALLGKAQEQKAILIGIYILQFGLAAFFLLVPDSFLLSSIPKLYFPNYYVAGSLYWIADLVNILIPLYFMYHMIRTYRVSDYIMKNRLKYLFVGFLLSYVFGYTAAPLVSGVPVDPIWSIFFIPFFAVPFTYAVLKYELMDIRIVAKQAFVYSVLVAGIGLFIGFLNFLNNYIVTRIPQFPTWIFPLASSFIAVTIGFIVWKKLRESDLLKYEFITVVTHKFRTPLTQIKWSVENLLEEEKKRNFAENKVESTQPAIQNVDELRRIQSATHHLVELTGLLADISDATSVQFNHASGSVSLGKMLQEIVDETREKAELKKVSIILQEGPENMVRIDKERLKAVLQIVIDNSVSYTPENGTVTIFCTNEKKWTVVHVQDTGIGISKDEQRHVFAKFYRGEDAKRADTEGMGIGLFTARQILTRQGGKMWVESEGKNKGSTFFIQIPRSS